LDQHPSKKEDVDLISNFNKSIEIQVKFQILKGTFRPDWIYMRLNRP
jgi:hypothetical protein